MSKMNTQDRLAQVPIFSGLPKAELRSVSRLMTSTTKKKGSLLTKQGQIGREFVIILEGEASVIIDDRKVATLSQGDFLGELSVLSGEPRTATVQAETDMLIEVLTRSELVSLLDQKPVVAKKMLTGVIKRYRHMRNSLRNITQ